MKNLLFDLDGTIMNSEKGIKNGFCYTFDKLKLTIPDDKTLTTFIGPPLTHTFKQFNTDPDFIQNAVKIYREYYFETGVFEAKPYPQIKEVLSVLKESQNLNLFITTSKTEEMAVKMLKRFDLFSFFNDFYGGIPQSSQKIDVVNRLLADYSINRKETTIIGDTTFDLVAGRTVGIKTAAALWGFGQNEDLILLADYLLNEPSDIKKIAIL